MKYITFLSLFIAVVIMVCGANASEGKNIYDTNNFLRIHIRANSNVAEDQIIKYAIKNEVVAVLTPILATCTTKEAAYSAINSNFALIENAANNILKKNGLKYESYAKLTNEYFPTRSYNEWTLQSGSYDSLVINLGEGQGNNWWCVVYPPLCFVNMSGEPGGQVVYKSKLLEIIKKFFEV